MATATEGPVSLGTTIVGGVYKDGIVLAADSQTSLGTYVANRVSDKLTMLADNVCMARAGTSAHSQLVIDHLRGLLESHYLQLNDQVPVKSAASMLQTLAYRNKDNLHFGAIVAGHDKYNGPSLYEIALGGTLVKTNFALAGSGSGSIYSWFDKNWKDNMSADQARHFVLHAVAHAMARDSASGGCIRIVMINAQGVHREFIPGDQVPHPIYHNKGICGFKTIVWTKSASLLDLRPGVLPRLDDRRPSIVQIRMDPHVTLTFSPAPSPATLLGI